MEKFIVVFDTNPIERNKYRIDSSPAMAAFFKKGLNIMVIPEVVRDELIKHYERDVRAAEQRLSQSINELKQLNIEYRARKNKSFKYDEYLDQTLMEYGAVLVEVERADLRFIFEKAQRAVRPFKSKVDHGKTKEAGGIKDAIIWSSVVNFLGEAFEDHTVVFVTNDGDFLDQQTREIHGDLMKDLERIGIRDRKKVRVVPSISALVTEIIEPSLPNIVEVHANIQNQIFEKYSYKKFSIRSIVHNDLATYRDDEAKMMRHVLAKKITEHLGFSHNANVIVEDIGRTGYVRMPFEVKLWTEEMAYLLFQEQLVVAANYVVPEEKYSKALTERRGSYFYRDYYYEDEKEPTIGETFYVEVWYEVLFSIIDGEVFGYDRLDDMNVYDAGEWEREKVLRS